MGEDVAVDAMKFGASDYLLKDRIARLGNAVQRALEDKQLRQQRQQAQEELRRTNEALRQMLAHSPAVIYTLRLEGQSVIPVLVSENIERLLGFTVAETMIRDWWLGRLHPDDRIRAMSTLADGVAGEGCSMEYRFQHKNGSYRWIQDSNRVVRDAASQPREIVGVWMDITRQKETKQQFRQAQKMECIGLLAGGVAHDFNNILLIIQVNLEWILNGGEEPSASDKETSRRYPQGRQPGWRLERPAPHLSRNEAMQMRILDLNDLAANFTQMLRRIVGEDIRVQNNFAPSSSINAVSGHD